MGFEVHGPKSLAATANVGKAPGPPPGTATDKIFVVKFNTVFPISQEAAELLDAGQTQLDAGHNEAALALFDRCNRLDAESGGNPVAYNKRSVALTHLGRFEDAKASMTAALHLEPGYPNALYNVATQLAREGHFDEALETFASGVFPVHQRYINGAKGDPDLDGLRPLDAGRSHDGYNFPITYATPAQMKAFARLLDALPAPGHADRDAILPPVAPTPPTRASVTALPSLGATDDPGKVEH